MLAQFIPHGHCYLWKTNLVSLHLISDSLTALSYYSIPITLLYFVRKRKDLPYASVFVLFGAFIVSCGTVHLIEIWTLWHPIYWLAGVVKAITALMSIYTAITIFEIVPKALNLPSQSDLKQANSRLEKEIEERRQIETDLEREKAFVKAMLDNLNDGIVACDRNGVLAFYNRASQEFFGMVEEPLPSPSNCWSADYRLCDLENKIDLKSENIPLFRAFSGESFIDAELISVSKSGEARILLANGSPLLDCQGQKLGAVVALRDVSDRRQMEIVLQESEERFRLAFENAATGMAMTDLKGSFLQVNYSLCKILGFTEKELIELDCQTITHPEDVLTSRENYRQLLAGEISNFEIYKRYIHKKGHIIWAFTSVSLVFEQQSKYFIAQIQDVTEQRISQAKLAQSLQEKEVMLQEIHHRVKNNLQVICSLLNLQSRYIKEPKTLKAFKETQNRVKSMALVHEQLYQSNNLSEIILSDYIKHLTDNLLRAYSVTTKIKCKLEIADFYLDLDTAVPCGLIINELITNAIKYAFDNQQGEILIQAANNDEDSLVLSIGDNGIGIDPNYDPEANKSLGLRLVKSLTEQLQGRYEIATEQNIGTKFEFTFDRIKQ